MLTPVRRSVPTVVTSPLCYLENVREARANDAVYNSPLLPCSRRTLYQPRLAAVPRRDPQLRQQRDLAAARADKVRPERQDGLVDDGVGPPRRVAVPLLEDLHRPQRAVVDAVPPERVDGAEEVGVVLLVGRDEDCGRTRSAPRRDGSDMRKQRTLCRRRRKVEEGLELLDVAVDGRRAVLARVTPRLCAREGMS